MVGAAGMAILFFMYLLAATILGIYVAGYAAHSFLTVVEDTAAGNDEVRWPHDPLVDWAWKFVYLGWLMLVWLVPALIVARIWAAGSPPETAFAKTAGMVAALFWLLFPITLLSSLSASSRWFVFSPAILPRLAQRPGTVAMFYLLTGPLTVIAPEAVEEYRISTNNFSAEYGRTSGFLANAITRAGGSHWHGLAYFYAKNESLNANGFAENAGGFSRRGYKESQPGFSIGEACRRCR